MNPKPGHPPDAMARSADVDELKNLIASGGALMPGGGSSPGQRRAKEVD
mgnify:CR=1 FL=1